MVDKQPIPIIKNVMAERSQGHETRQSLYSEIEAKIGRKLVCYFTSFRYNVDLTDSDIDMIAGILQSISQSDGVALMISSPGGSGLAAERLIKVCRTYSGTGDYIAIVPGKAKSAATIVCMGAKKIMMGPASELGPVDPQIWIKDNDIPRQISVHHIVDTYDKLFEDAVKEKEGNLQPYIQQLGRYDASVIEHHRKALELSKDIAVRYLQSGMMEGVETEKIEKKIARFLSPQKTKVHGRPIFSDEAKRCGLKVENLKAGNKLWENIYELYIRLNFYVSREVAKCIESAEDSVVIEPSD